MNKPTLSLPDPFPGCTGRGVHIGVIDSGVHPDHPHIDAAQLGCGVAIGKDGMILHDADKLDSLGHGTAVMAAIQEKAPDALCAPVRVFHDALRTTGKGLITAIDWCVAQRFDIINLSLGTVNPAHASAFEEAAKRASEAGVILVAAREAEGVLCYPGSLPQVLNVGLDWDCLREDYRVVAGAAGAIFYASGHPRPIPGVAQRRNLYGISFAVANMSGFVALAAQQLGRNLEPRDRHAALCASLMSHARVCA